MFEKFYAKWNWYLNGGKMKNYRLEWEENK